MKIQIENLKSQMKGRELNIYQKADALIEFNKLLDYVEELEQLTIPAVSESFSKRDLLDLGGWFDGSSEYVEEVVNDWLNAR